MRPLVLLALLAVVHTWPLSVAPASRSLNHHADAQLLEWTLSWIARAIVQQPAHLFDGNIFAPEPHVLALSDPMIVPGLMGAPARWLGASPVLTYNLVQIAGLTLTAWAAWFVAWRWTGSSGGALVSGALVPFNVHVLARVAHVQATHAWGLPLALYFADQLIERPTSSAAIRLALVIAATAATSLYGLTFACVIVGFTALAGSSRWRRLLAIAAAGLAGIVLALPVLWPYVQLGRAGATRPLDVVAAFSAKPAAYVTGNSRWYVWLTGSAASDELQVLFAGVTALALAAVGVFASRRDVRAGAGSEPIASEARRTVRRRIVTLLLIGSAGVLLSFGPATPIYRWLYDVALPLRGLRAVSRFAILYLMAVGLLAGFGVAWLTRLARPRWLRLSIAPVALALVTLESWTGPIKTEPFTGVPPIYSVLADRPAPVMLVEVPFFPADAVFENAEYVLNATAHWRPVMNGYSGATPASYRRRAEAFWYFPRDWAIDAMIQEGATHVMVHLDRFDERDRQDIAQALPKRADLRLVASDARGHRLYEIVRP